METYNITRTTLGEGALSRPHKGGSWRDRVTSHNKHLASKEAIDLMEKLIVYDPQERLTARQAMAHPFFRAVR